MGVDIIYLFICFLGISQKFIMVCRAGWHAECGNQSSSVCGLQFHVIFDCNLIKRKQLKNILIKPETLI